jgi:hypothetical protein
MRCCNTNPIAWPGISRQPDQPEGFEDFALSVEPGMLTVTGNYTQAQYAALMIQLAGANAWRVQCS